MNRDAPDEKPKRQLWRYRMAAAFLDMSEAALRNRVRRGEVPFVRVAPRTVRFDPEDLRVFVEERSRRPGQKTEAK